MLPDPPIRFLPAEIAVLRLLPSFSTWEWTKANLRVPVGPYRGQLWRPDVSPYAPGIMEAWDDPVVRKIFLIAPSQTTKTTIAYACVLASLARRLTPVGIGMPDEEAVRRIFKEKFIPLLRGVPELNALLATVGRMEAMFRDGSLALGIYGGSESRMSSFSSEYMIIDEEDAYQDKGAVGAMEERVIAYEHLGTSKIFRFSKPRGLEEESTIWRDALAEAHVIYRRQARCPACGHFQIMDDRRIKAEGGVRDPREILRRKLARYECERCNHPWTDAGRNLAVRAGRWVADRALSGERPSVVAFHLRSWDSILVSLSRVLHDWFAAQGDPRRLKAYDNNHKAVPFKVITRETPQSVVRKRIVQENPPQVVPAGAVALTCGIDVQPMGFWFVVRAWARSLESWLVHHGFLAAWSDVESLVFETTYPVQGMPDARMPIWRTAVDTGGTRTDQGWSKTEEVYGWLQENAGRGQVFGIKGASQPQRVNVRPTRVGGKPGVPERWQTSALVLYMLDTRALKDLIHYRLSEGSSQPMWLHGESRPGELEQYIRHLTSERKEIGKKGQETWEAGSRVNHLLDVEVYAAACADPLWAPPLRLLTDPVVITPRPPAPKPQASQGQEAEYYGRYGA